MTENNKDHIILKHYKKIAKSHGELPRSTMRDQYIRNAEVAFYIKELKSKFQKNDVFNLLDLGCGNGYLLSILRDEFPKARLFGLEFTPELYEVSKKREIPNCEIRHGDARVIDNYEQDSMDVILTERVLINILSRKQQYLALENILNWLKPGGHYLLIESFKEPLLNLNRALKEFLMDEIEVPPHNLFPYEESFERYREKIGFQKVEQVTPQNYLSTHFYLTRVVHLLNRPPGGKVWDTEFMKFFNEAMPVAIGNYSPILFKVYQK